MRKVNCPHCQASVPAPQQAGLSTTCTACGKRFITPEAIQVEEIKLQPFVNRNSPSQDVSASQPRSMAPTNFSYQQSDEQLEVLEDILTYVRKIHFCLTFPPLIGAVVFVVYLIASDM